MRSIEGNLWTARNIPEGSEPLWKPQYLSRVHVSITIKLNVLQFSIHSRSMQNDSREAEKWMYVEASKIIAMRKALVVLLQPLPSQKGLCHAQIKPITVAEKVQKWPLANENGESRDNAGNSK